MKSIATRGLLAAFALLIVAALGFARANSDPKARYDEIAKRYEQANKDFQKSMQDAKDQKEQMKLWEKRPGTEFIAEFRSVAVDAKGTATALDAWLQVLDIATGFGKVDDAKDAIDALMRDHIDSADLARVPTTLQHFASQMKGDICAKTLRDLVARSPHKTVQAAALYSLAQMLTEGDAKEKLEAHGMLERLVADYADVKTKHGTAYKDLAGGFLFELDHLQIGMNAPDFEATDENGAKFKLSDYRGKVVVIDYWGNW